MSTYPLNWRANIGQSDENDGLELQFTLSTRLTRTDRLALALRLQEMIDDGYEFNDPTVLGEIVALSMGDLNRLNEFRERILQA